MAAFLNKIFRPFALLKGAITPSYLGVDIGTTSIKIVEVRQGKKLPQLVNYAIIEDSNYLGRSNAALQTSSLRLFEKDAAELLREAVRQMKPQTNKAIASLPVFSVFIMVRDFPEMGAADLKRAVTFRARQDAPLPLAEVEFEWLPVGEYEDEKGFRHKQVLLIFFEQEQIQKYRRIFKLAGLTLTSLEIESLSIIRSLIGTDPTPTVVVDIGSRSTNIIFVEKGLLKFNAQTDFAGASLTQALSTGLNINPLRAEDLKKEKGISGGGADYELSTIMLPFLDVIINEVKKAQYNYEIQFPSAAKIERVILAGGGACLLGIEKYIGREFGIPVIKGAPLLKFEYPLAIEPFVGELNSLLGVAAGLGLREFG